MNTFYHIPSKKSSNSHTPITPSSRQCRNPDASQSFSKSSLLQSSYQFPWECNGNLPVFFPFQGNYLRFLFTFTQKYCSFQPICMAVNKIYYLRFPNYFLPLQNADVFCELCTNSRSFFLQSYKKIFSTFLDFFRDSPHASLIFHYLFPLFPFYSNFVILFNSCFSAPNPSRANAKSSLKYPSKKKACPSILPIKPHQHPAREKAIKQIRAQ